MKRSRAGKGQGTPLGYAKRLETGHHKGRCGEAEVEVSPETVQKEAKRLAQLLRDAPIVVAHTGAGLSTAAGIPDFRGKHGVWTLEKQGQPLPSYEKCWDNAVPTLGHMALAGLVNEGLVHAIVSQNVDGLHLRSGIPRERLCELHGNLFMEVCPDCRREFRRTADVGGVGFKPTGRRCPDCGGGLVDVLLDWEDELRDYEQAVDLSNRCREPGGVSLCLGTSLQIAPSKDLPAKADKMVIVNLQKTAKDARAAIVIRAKIDAVMRRVMQELGVSIPVYRREETLVVSHTCCPAAGGGKGDRLKWAIAVGDAADGARCGYIESVSVSFPGTKLSEAVVTSPPYRVSRTTKSPPPAAPLPAAPFPTGGGEGGRPAEEAEFAGGASSSSSSRIGVGECATWKEGSVQDDAVGADVGGAGGAGGDCGVVGGIDVGGSVGAAAAAAGAGAGSDRFITAVISLTFVAPPGRAAPESQTVEYRMDLSSTQGSREFAVFLGEVDYNDAG